MKKAIKRNTCSLDDYDSYFEDFINCKRISGLSPATLKGYQDSYKNLKKFLDSLYAAGAFRDQRRQLYRADLEHLRQRHTILRVGSPGRACRSAKGKAQLLLCVSTSIFDFQQAGGAQWSARRRANCKMRIVRCCPKLQQRKSPRC
jgi:hypothetical protein